MIRVITDGSKTVCNDGSELSVMTLSVLVEGSDDEDDVDQQAVPSEYNIYQSDLGPTYLGREY